MKPLFGKRYRDTSKRDPCAQLISNLTYNIDNDYCYSITVNGGTIKKELVDVTTDVFQYIVDRVMEHCTKYVFLPSEVYVSVGTPADFSLQMQEIVCTAIQQVKLGNNDNADNHIWRQNICIFSEPVAAAYCYHGFEDKSMSEFIIFDFGAGTLDLSLVRMTNNDGCTYTVVKKEGDNNLGGNIVDVIVYRMVMEEVEREARVSVELSDSSREVLLKRCRRAKEELNLSCVDSVKVDLRGKVVAQTPEMAQTPERPLRSEYVSLIPVGGSSKLRGLFDGYDRRICVRNWVDSTKAVSVGVACIGAINFNKVGNKSISYGGTSANPVKKELDPGNVHDVLFRPIRLSFDYGELIIAEGTPYGEFAVVSIPTAYFDGSDFCVEVTQEKENGIDNLGRYICESPSDVLGATATLKAWVNKRSELEIELHSSAGVVTLEKETL
ncbi:dnaK protein [Blastocystis sp. ATCC 50177/Nand II]|uniref:DnaK protein n=1 Tax=Blastocystis sp. subtype 1 (strain ATCC 50177 / NandII) TaxID=478820 RepID=A0A196SFR2_BLAHN|nr:dnaK protein [Blastocystis sp. ATCC 50177/Nand II]